MSTPVSLSPRDRSLLQLLSWTPATTALLHRASMTFDGGAFINERRACGDCRLPYVRLGRGRGTIRIREQDLDKFLQACTIDDDRGELDDL